MVWRDWRERLAGPPLITYGETGQVEPVIVAMPEGPYLAEAVRCTEYRMHRGLGWRAKLANTALGPVRTVWVVTVPGGIPAGLKASGWSHVMDGVTQVAGPTVDDAVRLTAETAVQLRRARRGPYALPHPMTVEQADRWWKAQQ